MPECGDPGWPFVVNGMCCQNTTFPLVLAGRTTVVCCPSDGSCAVIAPMSCDLRLYDPRGGGGGGSPPVVETIFTDMDLSECGEDCCPWGYSCVTQDGHNVCNRMANQSLQPDGKPFTSLASTSAVHATSSTASDTYSSRSSSSSSSSTLTSYDSFFSMATPTTSPVSSPSETSIVVAFPTGQPAGPQNTSGTEAGSGSSGAFLSVPKVVGIVVGSVVGITLACGALLYFLRRGARSKERNNAATTSDNSDNGGNTNAGEDAGATTTEAKSEGAVELPAIDCANELGDTQVPRLPPPRVYELA
ncbi:hypothetical protein F5Y19DRAFT_107374 [Xylariaceae sp. FL1651]|nr:hypothetical protein F5Y19DRAFT_107374 [Xylariaceae sp. FL1651]